MLHREGLSVLVHPSTGDGYGDHMERSLGSAKSSSSTKRLSDAATRFRPDMKRLHSAKDPLMIGHLKNVLATFGTKCVARNGDDLRCRRVAAGGMLAGAVGGRRRKILRARAILKQTLAPLQSVKKPWHCGGCGETIEGQFSECWNCGRDRHGRQPQSRVRPISSALGRR